MTPFRAAVEAARETAGLATGEEAIRLAGQVGAVLAPLAGDELDVIGFVIERLKAGRATYGPLRVDGDPRNFRHEAAEEAADLLVYKAAQFIRDRQHATPAPLLEDIAEAQRHLFQAARRLTGQHTE